MNKIQGLFLVVSILSFLAVLASLFFAATDSKNTVGFSIVAAFFVLTGAFWVYQFAKGRSSLG